MRVEEGGEEVLCCMLRHLSFISSTISLKLNEVLIGLPFVG